MGTKAQLLKGEDASNFFTHMAANRYEVYPATLEKLTIWQLNSVGVSPLYCS